MKFFKILLVSGLDSEDKAVVSGGPSYYNRTKNPVSYERGVRLGVYAFSKDDIDAALTTVDSLWSQQKADRILGGSVDPKLRDIIKLLNDEEVELC